MAAPYEIEKWGKPVDIEDIEQLTEPIINGYILWTIETYKMHGYKDKGLWEVFREDYEGWTAEVFKVANNGVTRTIQDYLREHGVFVLKQARVIINKELAKAISEDEYHTWTKEEIEYQMSTGMFDSRYNPQSKQFTPTSSTQQQFQQFTGHGDNSSSSGSYNNTQQGSSGRELANLLKIYSDDMKYGGGEDSLDMKLQIFYDMCPKAGVPPGSYSSAFSIMLKGDARDYYYDKISGRGLTFSAMTKTIREHFETEERRQQMLSKWNTTTLRGIIRDNDSKDMVECFELLLKELQKAQKGLAEGYQTEDNLRDRLINACREVQECSFACFKPASTFEGLCAELRASIATASRVATSQKSSFNNELDSQFYTDRRYHGGSRFRQTDQRQSYPRRDNQYPQGGGNKGKKCFVCKKEGCWSNRHSKEEQDQSFNSFKRRLQGHKKPFNDQRIKQYVMEFEGVPEDQDEDEYESLIMDLKFSDNDKEEDPEFDQFITGFGKVNGATTVALLNDQSAQHAITRTDPSDQSIYITEGRYSSTTFQGIMVDTGAARWSTAGQDQFYALQKV
jgi:hypothetical protein